MAKSLSWQCVSYWNNPCSWRGPWITHKNEVKADCCTHTESQECPDWHTNCIWQNANHKRESKRKGGNWILCLNFLQLLHCNVIDEPDKESSKIKMGTRRRFKINLYSQKHHRQPGLLAWCSCPICCQHFWQFTLAKLLHASLLCLWNAPLPALDWRRNTA